MRWCHKGSCHKVVPAFLGNLIVGHVGHIEWGMNSIQRLYVAESLSLYACYSHSINNGVFLCIG